MKKLCLLCLPLLMLCVIISCQKSSDADVGNMIGIWNKTVNNVAFKLYVPDSTHFSYTATINGTPLLASGTYLMGIGQCSFKETSSASDCPNVVGSYTFSATSTILTLTAGSDACVDHFAARSTILSGDWTKQ